MEEHKKIVREVLTSIETGSTEALDRYSGKYTQHNMNVPDGPEGLKAVLALLPKGSAEVNIVRVFADGPFVITHSEYNFFGPKVGFDVFRFEKGKIAEHWDNLSERAPSLNPSRRSQLDGRTEVTDREKTAENKMLVESFVRTVLIAEDEKPGLPLDEKWARRKELARRFMDCRTDDSDACNYRQHNVLVADGLNGLISGLKGLEESGQAIKFEKIHMVLGEGNFVLVMTEGKFGAAPVAYYDLWRVERGKLVEHWDVIEPIPATSKNPNWKF